MNKENKITINNLIYALLFLVFGIIVLTSTDDLITMASKVIGALLILIGIVKSIVYIYMKGKLGDYSLQELIIGLFIICCGVVLIISSGAFSFVIRVIIGMWILFVGIDRMIYAISLYSYDKKEFAVFLLTSIIMLVLGVLIISAVFDKIIGVLIIIYSVAEIIDYIYYKVKNKKVTEEIVPVNNVTKKTKRIKGKKTVDAKFEEDK